MPKVSELKISDDELRETIESNQLKKMQERARISRSSRRAPASWPTTSATSMSAAPGRRSATSCAIAWRSCFRPLHRRGDAAAVPRRRSRTCIPELEKCVKEYGFVGINLNPIPRGSLDFAALSDRHWYPIYEKMVEYDIPP